MFVVLFRRPGRPVADGGGLMAPECVVGGAPETFACPEDEFGAKVDSGLLDSGEAEAFGVCATAGVSDCETVLVDGSALLNVAEGVRVAVRTPTTSRRQSMDCGFVYATGLEKFRVNSSVVAQPPDGNQD